MIDVVQNSLPVMIYPFTVSQQVTTDSSKEAIDRQTSEQSKNEQNEKAGLDTDNYLKTETKEKQTNFNDLAKKIQSAIGEDNLSIQFSLDKDSKKMILKIIDDKTKEIVQQIPPELALKIARIVANSMENGNITDAKI